MASFDDDDEQEWSIHDLDHAPPPPGDAAESFRLSPRSRSRSEDILVHGGLSRGRLFPGPSSANVLGSSSVLASNVPPGYRRGRSHSSNEDLVRRGPLFGRGELAPLRSRSASNSDDLFRSHSSRPHLLSSGSSGSLPSSGPAHTLGSVKSFPPPDRRVAFSDDEIQYEDTELGMLSLPETEEESSDALQQQQQQQHYQDPLAPPITSEYDENRSRRRFDSHGTFTSDSASEDEQQEQEDTEIDDSGISRSKRPIFFMGMQMPLWLNKRPSWNRMAAFAVTRAPCFWCFKSRTPTDRSILQRLNILLAFFSIFQIVAGVWLGVILLAPGLVERDLEQTPWEEEASKESSKRIVRIIFNAWNISGTLLLMSVVCLVIFTSAIFAVRIIRDVNLAGAIRYLWVMLWLLPIALYFDIQLFDYFDMTSVWVKHWWRGSTMAWFRHEFCEPGTYNTLCAVPIITEPEDGEKEWCLTKYNSTACTAIRDAAQSDTERTINIFYTCNAAWGLLLICVLLLAINVTQDIISRPLVQKSRESNVPAWLALPIIGCALIGALFSFSDTSVLNTRSGVQAYWLGPLYLATAGLFFLAALLGWYTGSRSILNTRDKRRKMVAVYFFIISMVIILFLLATIFSASIAFSVALEANPLDDDIRGTIACFIDEIGSCTRCGDEFVDSEKCPEWSRKDVTTVLQTQAKASAAWAAICLIYGVAALRFGFTMRKHITMYQIDYV